MKEIVVGRAFISSLALTNRFEKGSGYKQECVTGILYTSLEATRVNIPTEGGKGSEELALASTRVPHVIGY